MKTRVVKLPDIGEGVTEAEIVEWHVAVGDVIAEDQSIGTVVTDKAAVEIPSPSAGTVVALSGQIGDVLAVGAELARIEPVALNATGGKDALSETRSTAEARSPERDRSSAGQTQSSDEGESKRNGSPDRGHDETHQGSDPVSSTREPSESASVEPIASALSDLNSVGPESSTGSHRKARAAPAVRRRARERGVELSAVPGTGPERRVTHEDLDRYLASLAGQDGQAESTGYAASTSSVESTGFAASTSKAESMATRPDRSDEVKQIAIVGVRRQIARHMQLASRSIPHFSYVEELDVTLLEALRAPPGGYGDRGQSTRLSPLPFIVMAIVRALEDFPDMNARFDAEAEILSRHSARNVGVATQTDNGLVVPVVRHAESLGLHALAAEIARLAEAARSGQATREELSGGTITVSSLGALGGIASTPIINLPEVAIIGVNRIVERPVCHQGRIEVRRMMNLSASFDHRVVDGYDAARFVQSIRAFLEHPGRLFGA